MLAHMAPDVIVDCRFAQYPLGVGTRLQITPGLCGKHQYTGAILTICMNLQY